MMKLKVSYTTQQDNIITKLLEIPTKYEFIFIKDDWAYTPEEKELENEFFDSWLVNQTNETVEAIDYGMVVSD